MDGCKPFEGPITNGADHLTAVTAADIVGACGLSTLEGAARSTTKRGRPKGSGNTSSGDTRVLINDIIVDIVNEMEEESERQNMLQQPDVFEDEGIELNPYIDIEMDIEPFDFNIEVEHYDF